MPPENLCDVEGYQVRGSRNATSFVKILVKPISPLKYKLFIKLGEIRDKIRYANFRPSSKNATVFGIADHVASLAALLQRRNMEMFLRRLAELVGRLSSEALIGRALYVPELDELTHKAALIVAPVRSATMKSKLLIHVATEVFPIGGHSNVLEDIVTALPDYHHAVILTAMDSSHPAFASMNSRFDALNVQVHLLTLPSRAERVKELSSLIGTLGPGAVLILANREDGIAYSAVTGSTGRRVLFLHHVDHEPSLGATRRDYAHIDLTPACHRVCASRHDLHASLLSLTSKDIGTVRLADRSPAIGVTCGSPYKYEGSIEFSYAQLAAALFAGGVSRLFHIGDMGAAQKDQICTQIVAAGQDSNRLVFLPNVPSLATKLIEISPDFYLTSHPLGGGKATVEALSVGLPILFVCPASRLPLLGPDMTFGVSIPVSALGQVPAAIRRLELEKNSLARRSRETYETHYSAKAFREGLLRAINPDSNRS